MPPSTIVDSTSVIARAKYSRKNGPHRSTQADEPPDLSKSIDRLMGAFIRACSDRMGHTYAKLYRNNSEFRSVVDSLGWSSKTIHALLRKDPRFRFRDQADGTTAIALVSGYVIEEQYILRTGPPIDRHGDAQEDDADLYRGQHTSDEDDDYNAAAEQTSGLTGSVRPRTSAAIAPIASENGSRQPQQSAEASDKIHQAAVAPAAVVNGSRQSQHAREVTDTTVQADLPPARSFSPGVVERERPADDSFASIQEYPRQSSAQEDTLMADADAMVVESRMEDTDNIVDNHVDLSSQGQPIAILHTETSPETQDAEASYSAMAVQTYEPLLDSSDEAESLHSMMVEDSQPLPSLTSHMLSSRSDTTSHAPADVRADKMTNSAEEGTSAQPAQGVQFVPASTEPAADVSMQPADSPAIIIAADIPMAVGPALLHKSRKRDEASEVLPRQDMAVKGNIGSSEVQRLPMSERGSVPLQSDKDRDYPYLDPYTAARATGAYRTISAATASTDGNNSTRASSAVSADLSATEISIVQSASAIQKARNCTSALRVHRSRPNQSASNAHQTDSHAVSDQDDVLVHVATKSTVSVGKPGHNATRTDKDKRRSEKRGKRPKKPLPNFRHNTEQEHVEYTAAYAAWQDTQSQRSSGWQIVCAFEEISRRHKDNTEMNTVKFWPYNLPYPGRRKGQAIVAVAGGCIIRCFRLSVERGVQELWCSIDESVVWEKESDQENYTTMEWTYELREDGSVDQMWRKWPLLVVAGRGREIKVLDGYSGTVAKVMQGHGGAINCLVVHPALPHCVATASMDETIAIWDISAPIPKPEVVPKYHNPAEQGKKRKPYAEGERLCIFAGLGGHIEGPLSIAFHPSLPLLMSGGIDCKLRIWQIPDCLPKHPSRSNLAPQSCPQPHRSRKPVIVTFPLFTQASLHSHHIDHVEFLGHDGVILTRSYCYDSVGKRVVRVFRPTFFDMSQPLYVPESVGSAVPSVPADVDMIARWTFAGCSENIGDGTLVVACDIVKDLQTGLPAVRRQIMVPSTEPLVHVQALNIDVPQEDVDDRRNTYDICIGDEVIRDSDPKRVCQLRSIAFQNAGWQWLVGAGEAEKLSVWCKGPDSASLLESPLNIS